MKEKLRKSIYVIVVFTIVMSMALINVFADVTADYSSCADHYFDELTGNAVPNNVSGSCGYVAATMLLAYYDAYWNDNFVSDLYEQDVEYNSENREFGSSTFNTENARLSEWYMEYLEDGGTGSFADYVEEKYSLFVEHNRNLSFLHLYLIGIGIDNGYYSGIFENEPYSSSIYETAEVLDIYFDGIFGDYRYYDPYELNNNPEEIPPIKIKTMTSGNLLTDRNDVLAKISELTSENIPVMYRGENSTDVGHRMILYSIQDQESNIIDYEMHTGWISESHTTLNTTEYNSDIAILWLEIDKSRIPHVCCNNYVEGDDKYCSCQVYGKLHPEHEHESNGIYSSYNNETHMTYCRWDGKEFSTEHTYGDIAHWSSDFHWYECSCGDKTMSQAHTLVSEYDEEENIHYYTCYCGYREERHELTYQNVGGGYHLGTCDCGYTVRSIHTMVKKNPKYSVCMHCGYVLYHNDDIIEWPGILNHDDEEETE